MNLTINLIKRQIVHETAHNIYPNNHLNLEEFIDTIGSSATSILSVLLSSEPLQYENEEQYSPQQKKEKKGKRRLPRG